MHQESVQGGNTHHDAERHLQGEDDPCSMAGKALPLLVGLEGPWLWLGGQATHQLQGMDYTCRKGGSLAALHAQSKLSLLADLRSSRCMCDVRGSQRGNSLAAQDPGWSRQQNTGSLPHLEASVPWWERHRPGSCSSRHLYLVRHEAIQGSAAVTLPGACRTGRRAHGGDEQCPLPGYSPTHVAAWTPACCPRRNVP